MDDPLDKAGASAPPVIGNGCTQRYDPDHLHAALGTDFPGASELWARYRLGEDSVAGPDMSVVDDQQD